MRTLVLIRHAKSDWGNPGTPDHDRPLNERGLRDGPVMAQRLRAAGTMLDAIVASTALRARTTAGFFGDALGLTPELRTDLYGASPRTLLAVAASSGADRVALVAHDPGMTALAGRLSGGGIAAMPTCAVATFRWDAEGWDIATAIDPDAWSFDSPR
ncbi:SixA phosphatase family protein [Microbacterium sp.]|uniref:SixA phosphatase family protein n=1 Tax=Microbacterium sp. TaxID=51671 RepID=UPI003A8A6ACC